MQIWLTKRKLWLLIYQHTSMTWVAQLQSLEDGKFAFPDHPRAQSTTTIALVNENKCDTENVDELTQNILSPKQAEENPLRLSNNLPTFTIEEEQEDETGSTNGSNENVACSAETS